MTKVTFTPEALQAVIAQAVAEALKSPKKQPLADSKSGVNGKTDRQLKNEVAVVRAFKKAGYGTVTPHKDVMTFNRWVAAGFRPVEGSKSLKVKNLRLFHKSQVRAITEDEKSELKASQEQAIARHQAKSGDNVVPMTQ